MLLAKSKCRSGVWEGPGEDELKCEPVACAPLPPIAHGRAEPPACQLPGPAKVGTKCEFYCDRGYGLDGPRATRCTRKQRWRNLEKKNPKCIRLGGGNNKPTGNAGGFPSPFIVCPPDITKPLPDHGATSVYVMFPQPKTNVDWFR